MIANCHKILPCVAFAGVMSLTISCSALAKASDAKPEVTLHRQLEAFHGHVCAGSIFGARMGLAAKEALKAAGGTGKYTAKYYDLSCPVDGIQMGAGTTYGNAAIVVEDRDEHRLVLTAVDNKRQVEVRLTKKAEELGLRSRELGKKAKTLGSGTPERVLLEREIETVYGWLRTAPTEEVVIVAIPKSNEGKR
jgi:formylmethanofuran dehydrogenase subunit E